MPALYTRRQANRRKIEPVPASVSAFTANELALGSDRRDAAILEASVNKSRNDRMFEAPTDGRGKKASESYVVPSTREVKKGVGETERRRHRHRH